MQCNTVTSKIRDFPACQEDILMMAKLYCHIELRPEPIIILPSISWAQMTSVTGTVCLLTR
jgi:hypothetical protein